MTPRLALIAAVARNNVIGAKGGLPWKLPSDMAFFKRVTMGKPVIMGRRTFETLDRPLKGRPNFVITNSQSYRAPGVHVVHSFDDAVAQARQTAQNEGVDEVFVIGGGQVYRRAMRHADRLYITHVDAEPEGDVLFPRIDPDVWVGFTSSGSEPSDSDTESYEIKVYERRSA